MIFRLGRLIGGNAKGPGKVHVFCFASTRSLVGDEDNIISNTSGIFFVLPCIESFAKVDLRTVSFNVPPQEVCLSIPFSPSYHSTH